MARDEVFWFEHGDEIPEVFPSRMSADMDRGEDSYLHFFELIFQGCPVSDIDFCWDGIAGEDDMVFFFEGEVEFFVDDLV